MPRGHACACVARVRHPLACLCMVASRARHRRWDFLEGMVSWLKGETTEALGELERGSSVELPTAKAALEPKLASRMRWQVSACRARVHPSYHPLIPLPTIPYHHPF